jgi:uncharacterized protein involved in response to NO
MPKFECPITHVSPALLAAAPHRLLFFAGASNVRLAMLWWTLWLADARWDVFGLPQPSAYAGWLHAIVMQYFVLPPFIFGFLLTVFPRWMNLPALAPRHYVPVGSGLLAGQALTLAGLLGAPSLLVAGVSLTLFGFGYGTAILLVLLWRDSARTLHAASCVVALVVGFCGLALYAAYLVHGDPMLAFVAIKIGTFGFLLPIFLTVAHRMFPFFASVVVSGYVPWRSMPWLLASIAAALVHAEVDACHGSAWLWVPDSLLTALTATWLVRNWPRGAMPPLLRMLFVGYAWLPVAMALFTAQSAWYAVTGGFVLGRAPSHALFVGFFGSLLVAMVTRVTQGHSGRPLTLGPVAAFAFFAVQGVAVVRVVAELVPDARAWQAFAAVGWLLAFVPWALYLARIYLTPRADRQPG